MSQLTGMPMLQIRYAERVDAVTVTPGDLFGVWHFAEARQMKHENLPALMFQLIDRGYSMARDTDDHDGFVLVWAFSREYVRQQGGW